MDKLVVVVANLPCTAGTFQTHYIARLLSDQTWITGETNPVSRTSPISFSPEDPWHFLRSSGVISQEDCKQEYARRLHHLLDVFIRCKTTKILLIRDHTLGEAPRFRRHPSGSLAPELIRLIESRSIPLFCFFTHRDPFDALISTRRSFRGIGQAEEFRTAYNYAELYQKSWTAWKMHAEKFLDVRIEDLVDHEREQQARILLSLIHI